MNAMQPEPTLCEDCDFVVADTRKRSPYTWLCVRHKRLPGGSFVTREPWSIHEPFLRCRDVNGGHCELFQPMRTGEIVA